VIWFDCFSRSVQIYMHQSCNCLFIMMIYSIYCWNAPLICLCHYNIGGRLCEFYMHMNFTYISGNKFSAYLLFIILNGCVSCGWSAHKLNMWVERELRIPLTSASDVQYPLALSAYVEEDVVRRVTRELGCRPCAAWAVAIGLISMGVVNFLLIYYDYTNLLAYSFPGTVIVFLMVVCFVSAAHRRHVRQVLARARAEWTQVRWDLNATHLVITYPFAAPTGDYGAKGYTAPVEPA
jgi:hypothetical protein